MTLVIDHDAVRQQLSELDDVHAQRDHQTDKRRRRAVQGLSAVSLLSSAAREMYRREVFETLPTARYLLDADRHRWLTTLHPHRESVGGSTAQTSAQAASLVLSSIGGERRAQDQPWLSLVSAGFMAFRAATAGRQLIDELADGHLDTFTVLDAVTSAAAVPLAIPEAVRAIRGLMDRES